WTRPDRVSCHPQSGIWKSTDAGRDNAGLVATAMERPKEKTMTQGDPDCIFRGLSAFPITPSHPDGRVDVERLYRLLSRLRQAGVDSVGLLGSTGTYAYLSRTERRRAVEAAVECLDGRVPLIVGVGALRTDEAEALARDAEAAGADGLLLAPVSYTQLLDEEVFRHFQSVARASGLPVCIYNNPSTTHFTFGPALIERLSEVPGIVALKNPAPASVEVPAEIDGLRARLPEGFSIGYSGDWNCAAALLAGGDAWYSVVAGLLPDPALRLTRAAQAGNRSEVERLDWLFRPLWDLFREFGSLRVMYAAAEVLGVSDLPPPRPILPISAANRDRVAGALHALGTDRA
ncbi:MAG TPA: dihydrodipicolinate synthase family protein, partial [Paracoccaceae bacterium]|nr:dihydrodipicolinate synthase family protein [Paracoccaceae bacterium]